MRLLEGDGLIVMRLFGVGPVLGFQLKSDYEGAQAAVLAEVIRIVRVHCAHPRGAVGVALAALLAQAAVGSIASTIQQTSRMRSNRFFMVFPRFLFAPSLWEAYRQKGIASGVLPLRSRSVFILFRRL